MVSFNTKNLIARCGMNCSVCVAYQRKRNTCPGCRAPDADKPKTRVVCKIKTCDFFQTSKAEFCYECPDFPCKDLLHLDKRYRTKYNMSMVENLEEIESVGIDAFGVAQQKRYTCSACGGIVCVHSGSCSSCGDKIFNF